MCHIRVAPRKVFYCGGQKKELTSHHWMLEEYWCSFEGELKKVLSACKSASKESAGKYFLKTESFLMHPCIKVQIKQSSCDQMCSCVGNTGKEAMESEVSVTFECCIEYLNMDQWMEEVSLVDFWVILYVFLIFIFIYLA